MNEIVKEFNGSKVRIVEKDGIHWFVAKDICKYFGDSDHKRSISRLDKDEISLAKVKDSLGRMQNATVVNEPGLYHLLFNFQPEQARCKDGGARIAPQIKERVEKIRKFKRWVTHEVLPSIRKTGAYLSPGMSNEQVKALVSENRQTAYPSGSELPSERSGSKTGALWRIHPTAPASVCGAGTASGCTSRSDFRTGCFGQLLNSNAPRRAALLRTRGVSFSLISRKNAE